MIETNRVIDTLGPVVPLGETRSRTNESSHASTLWKGGYRGTIRGF